MSNPLEYSDRELRDLFDTYLPREPLPREAEQRARARMQAAASALAERAAHPEPRQWLTDLLAWRPQLGLTSTLVLINAAAVALIALIVWWFGPFTSPPRANVFAEGDTLSVTQARTGTAMRVAAGSNVQLEPGDQLATENGSATIRFFDGQVTRLGPRAVVTLLKLSRENGGTQVELLVARGRAESDVRKSLRAVDQFTVRSPLLTTNIQGTQFVVEARSDSETYVATVIGKVRVRLGAQEVLVGPGDELVAVAGQPLQVQRSFVSRILDWLTQNLQTLIPPFAQ